VLRRLDASDRRSAPALPKTRPSLPIVEHLRVRLDESERRELARIAARLRKDDPLLDATEPFGPGVCPGVGPGPALVLEDHTGIALFDPDGDRAYAYRALLLAGDGDWVVVPRRRNRDFERYCREVLRLDAVEVVVPRAGAARRQRSFAARCADDGRIMARLAERARSVGLQILPYMGSGHVWRLAGALAAACGTSVRVAAPPPRLTQRVNDKLWFAERVAEVLGRRALPPSLPAFSLSALTRELAYLARSHGSVAVKVPDSAGSCGNFVLSAAEIRDSRPRALERHLRRLLRHAGWRGGFPLLVTAWEQPVLASPSVQLWLPAREQGGPVVEGVFDQLLTGPEAAFAGAVPSALPMAWQRRLAREGAQLGALFQELGYFGRCSLDAIILGEPLDGELHWVECNGRWGGVSIPMTLANRLVGDWHRRPFVVVDHTGLNGPRRPLAWYLERIADELFIPGEREEGAVFLSPGRIEDGTGLQLMVLDRTLPAARRRAERVVARLEGLLAT